VNTTLRSGTISTHRPDIAAPDASEMRKTPPGCVTLVPPSDPSHPSSFLNIRVADIGTVYKLWSACGAEFLTPPIDRGSEIRCCMRDPDGHLIEVGHLVGRAGG
jgi:hypothetical protein